MQSCKCAFVCVFFGSLTYMALTNQRLALPVLGIYLKGFSPDIAIVISFPQEFDLVSVLLISSLCTSVRASLGLGMLPIPFLASNTLSNRSGTFRN